MLLKDSNLGKFAITTIFAFSLVAGVLFTSNSTSLFAQTELKPRKSRLKVDEKKSSFTDEQLEFFEKKVRPLFAKRCAECHGPKSDPAEGNLRISSRSALIRGGDTGAAITPHHAAKSLLIKSVKYEGVYEMPPETKLSAEEIGILTKWIDDGAAWPKSENNESVSNPRRFDLNQRKSEHWCWQQITQPEIPDVSKTDWPNNSVDNFILSKLESAGIDPAKPANRRVLIRRIYFDLIGLPPTPEQVQAFVDDPSPKAVQTVVNQLLDSPRFGEHWARHWLDLARYAESFGHQYDYNMPHAYRYRDYLIRAFNNDVSYKQLIHEHIAGDLLKTVRRHPTEDFNESILATAFWYLGQAKPSAVDSRANEADLIDDRIDTMTKTFLGMTVSCARCHDHKFDAISTADYYALAGFFQSSRRQLAMLDPGRKIEQSFDKASLLVQQSDRLVQNITERLANLDSTQFAKYLRASIDVLRARDSNDADRKTRIAQVASSFKIKVTKLTKLTKVLSDESSNRPGHPLYPLRLAIHSKAPFTESFAKSSSKKAANSLRAKREWQANSTLFADFKDGIPADWFQTGFAFNGKNQHNPFASFGSMQNLFSNQGSLDSGRFGKEFYGVIRSPTFQLKDPKINYRIRGRDVTVRLIIDGFFMDEYRDLLYREARKKINSSTEYRWQTQSGDIGNHLGAMAHIEIIDHGNGFASIDEIRFSKTNPPTQTSLANEAFKTASAFRNQETLSDKLADSVVSPLNNPGDEEFANILNWFIAEDLLDLLIPNNLAGTELLLAIDQLKTLGKQINFMTAKTPKPMMSIGMTDGNGEDERIFIRGNHKTLGKVVRRRFLSAIAKTPAHIETGSGRLELAEQFTARTNPLTSRVAVNRVWHHLFGKGIVESVDNFGVLGKRPSHPELLDHLAMDFMANQWSFKHLIRKIVLSKTYQMASIPSKSGRLTNPDNTLLHRANVRRLQAESIRDSILKVSGGLNEKMYGDPVPVHLTPFMTGRGRPRKSGPLDGHRRRSIYLAVRRNFMSPFMLSFDAPVPISTTGRRNRSNVPAQALIMMNSPFVNQQARVWAERLVGKPESINQRIHTIYHEALGRLPVESEIKKGNQFINSLAQELDIDAENISDSIVVWKEYCHIIYNLKEFIYLN